MITPIVLHTVPHTGTHFVEKAFEIFGLEQDKDFCRAHAPRMHEKSLYPIHAQKLYLALTAHKLVVTARDPYLSAIRWVSIGRSRTVLQMSYAWQHFFNVLNKQTYFIVDVGCREKDRLQHLHDLGRFLGVNYNNQSVIKFAEAWQPEYSSDTDAKRNYLERGILPNPHLGNWSMLDKAAAWYKSLPTNDFCDK